MGLPAPGARSTSPSFRRDRLLTSTGSSSAPPSRRAEHRTVVGATLEVPRVEHPGVALNLTESQGALLVEKGLVTPAIFYAGLGVTCDVLAGFVYAGYWVDHVGDVVPGVAVYPYYIPSAG